MKDTKIQVFCFPHAGGSASVYYKWNRYIDNAVYELIPIEYAGHGTKIDQNLHLQFDEIVDDVYKEILKKISNNTKYILFGHSMGAYIALEVERRIEKKENKKALHMIFSGVDAPCYWNRNNKVSLLKDREFLNEIQKFGGIDKEIIKNSELLEIILPILKADFHIIESMGDFQEDYKLDAAFTIMNGNKDRYKKENIEYWKHFTNASCVIKYFNGGHFFINENFELICSYVNSLNNR